MKYQYCISALLENLSTNEAGKNATQALVKAVEQLEETIQLQLSAGSHQHKIQFEIVSKSSFDVLQSSLQNISAHLQIDLILHHWQDRELVPGLLIMDMDSTLVQAETIDEIARVAGVGDKVAAITESAMAGELDFTESLNARVAMLKGVAVKDIDSVHDCLPLTAGAKHLLAQARIHGCHTALVSGGFTMFAEPIAKKLAFDTLSANIFEIVEGKLTGKVIGNIVDGNSKLQTLNRLQQQLGIHKQQIIAIGDGANDLAMLAAAGTGIAFHAKAKVQQQATAVLNVNNLNAVCWLLNW